MHVVNSDLEVVLISLTKVQFSRVAILAVEDITLYSYHLTMVVVPCIHHDPSLSLMHLLRLLRHLLMSSPMVLQSDGGVDLT